MKRLIILLSLILGFSQSHATHMSGAEIYWECLGNGQYKFYVHFYGDCGTATALLPQTAHIASNSPAGQITLQRTHLLDITNSCPASNISCGSAPSGSGATRMAIYESDSITLTGIPPATGWEFNFVVCCRPHTTNLTNPSSQSFGTKAYMFRYNNNGSNVSADNCYDNSPRFSPPPRVMACTQSNFTYNAAAIDTDGDSLYYYWAPVLNGNHIANYATGYSPQNPFPGTHTFDNENGVITINNPNTVGTFAHAVGVESWRKNNQGQYVKISQTDRSYNLTFVNCNNTSTPSLSVNSIPGGGTISPHPTDSFTYVMNAIVGDSIEFEVEGQESNQTITLKGMGGNLPVFSDSSKCLYGGNCASFTSLNANNTFTSQNTSSAKLSWVPDCQNLRTSDGRILSSREIVFYFTAENQGCPVVGSSTIKVIVNIQADPNNTPSAIDFSGTITNRLPNDDVEFGWPQYSGPAAEYFLLYRNIDSVNMINFSVFDTIWNVDTTYYLDTSKHQGPIWYYMTVVNACGQESDSSDIISSVWLNVSGNSSTNKTTASIDVDLTWNRLMPIPNPTYEVWRKDASNTWLLEATTQLTHYSHNIPETERYSEYELRYNGQTLSNTTGGLQNVGLDEDEYSTTYIYHHQGAAMLYMGHVWQQHTTTLTLTDVSGRMVYREDVAPSSSNPTHALPSHLPQGLYLLQINGGGKSQVLKVNL